MSNFKEGYQPQQIVQPEAKAQGGPASREQPPLPQKSELNRAVERTRELYERNGWTFLPLGGVGEDSPTLPSLSPTIVLPPPSHDILLEEPKKLDKNKSHHEESPKVPHPRNKTESQQLDPIARAMREAARREGIDPQSLIQELNLKLQQMLADYDPREAENLQRMFDIPPDPSAPSPEDLQ